MLLELFAADFKRRFWLIILFNLKDLYVLEVSCPKVEAALNLTDEHTWILH